jgi:hypothetical protein
MMRNKEMGGSEVLISEERMVMRDSKEGSKKRRKYAENQQM